MLATSSLLIARMSSHLRLTPHLHIIQPVPVASSLAHHPLHSLGSLTWVPEPLNLHMQLGTLLGCKHDVRADAARWVQQIRPLHAKPSEDLCSG